MTPERRLEILTATRDLIADKRRWGQGTLVQHTIVDKLMMRPPSYCLMGAIMVACSGLVDYNAEVYEMCDFLGGLIPDEDQRSAYGLRVFSFNDTHEHHEVLDLVRSAIFHTEVEIATNDLLPLIQLGALAELAAV